MKYTIAQWKDKIRKEREQESLDIPNLIEDVHKTLITLKNGGFWTQEELEEKLKNDSLYQTYKKRCLNIFQK